MKATISGLLIYIFLDCPTGKRFACYRKLRADRNADETSSRSYENSSMISAGMLTERDLGEDPWGYSV